VTVLATGEGLPAYDLDGLHLSELRSGRGAGVAVAETHPFAVRDWVDTEELVGQAWVVGASVGDSPEFGAWPGIEEPEVSFAVRDWPTRLGLVAAGLGIALVPGFAAPVPHGVRWIPVRDQGGGLVLAGRCRYWRGPPPWLAQAGRPLTACRKASYLPGSRAGFYLAFWPWPRAMFRTVRS